MFSLSVSTQKRNSQLRCNWIQKFLENVQFLRFEIEIDFLLICFGFFTCFLSFYIVYDSIWQGILTHLKFPCSKSLACWKIFVLTNFLYNNTKTRVEKTRIRVETTRIFVLWKFFFTKFAVLQHKNFNTKIFQHASDFEHGSFKCVHVTLFFFERVKNGEKS
jgi:hypothetical protein